MVEAARLRRPPDAGLPAGDPRAGQDRRRWTDFAPLSAQQTREIVYSILNDDQRKRFENHKQLDFAYAIPGVARFRVNCFFQRGSISAAFRLIPQEIPSARLARRCRRCCEELTRKPRGFVLVTGPTGSGKSTTLAAMIDMINERARGAHPHDRGPDRVPAPAQALHRQPARDRRRRDGLRPRPEGRPARGPRRDPRRRDARPGDDLHRADRGRDRPPRLRHPAHPVDRADGRPDHRRLPAPAAGARCGCSSRSRLQGIVTQQLLPTADGDGPRRSPARCWSRPRRSAT